MTIHYPSPNANAPTLCGQTGAVSNDPQAVTCYPCIRRHSRNRLSYQDTALKIRRRIQILHEYVNEPEDDNTPEAINPESEADIERFLETHPRAFNAYAFLTHSGNLRLVWKDLQDDETHLGLEFRGQGQVQYVVFRRLPGAAERTLTADDITLDQIPALAEKYQIRHLLDSRYTQAQGTPPCNTK